MRRINGAGRDAVYETREIEGAFAVKKYTLDQVYGLAEVPNADCPTYLDRDAHTQFRYTIASEKQHVVVYGASRQGKTWLIERYCPSFVRVGCDTRSTRASLFRAILSSLGMQPGQIQTRDTTAVGGALGANAALKAKVPIVASGSLEVSGNINMTTEGERQFTYVNVDLEDPQDVIKHIRSLLNHRIIVIENFHYLDQSVQKSFAATLKEFHYHEIRVVVVGVWKESTKLVSMVSDLSNRVESIDIGDWSGSELKAVVKCGDQALNVETDDGIVEDFIRRSGQNVGIFKTLLKNFCKLNGVLATKEERMRLDSRASAEAAVERNYQDAIVPLFDRIRKLATSKKSATKGLRYYIVRALLEIMDETEPEKLLQGIPLDRVTSKIDSFNEEEFQFSNVKQELQVLHTREETVVAEKDEQVNLIPLFYYDQGKDRVLIVESALISAKYYGRPLTYHLGSKDNYVKGRSDTER